MRAALTGPSALTEFDEIEITKYIHALVSQGYHISILAYNSVELVALKYFVKNIKHADQLTIYTFQNFENISSELQISINYLTNKGSIYKSFSHNEFSIKRSFYLSAWNEILQDCDTVVSFYDGKKPSLLIPIDEAKKRSITSMIYYLPGEDEGKHHLSPKHKTKMFNF